MHGFDRVFELYGKMSLMDDVGRLHIYSAHVSIDYQVYVPFKKIGV